MGWSRNLDVKAVPDFAKASPNSKSPRAQRAAGFWSFKAIWNRSRAILAALVLPVAVMAGELPSGFVYLRDVAPEIAQDIRYAGAYNFTSAPVPGYEAAECVLTRPAAEALIGVQATLRSEGFELIVWDCYRPAQAVAWFSTWAHNPEATGLGAIFFPGYLKSKLHALGFIAERSSHSRGSALDLGLILLGEQPLTPLVEDSRRCDAAFADRPRESSVDMGSNFDCFSPASGTGADIPAQARLNRAILSNAMRAAGFTGYSKEWWHFRLVNEPFPKKAFDFVISARD